MDPMLSRASVVYRLMQPVDVIPQPRRRQDAALVRVGGAKVCWVVDGRERWPFTRFGLDGGLELVVHHPLMVRLRHASLADKPLAHLSFSLDLDDGTPRRYGDDKRMGKVYVTRAGEHAAIPCWDSQGAEIVSAELTLERFIALLAGRRKQTQVFLVDQSALSAADNIYADEILFDAGLHPKTPYDGLSEQERRKLFSSIGSVIAWGIAEVEKAARPTELEARDHVKARGQIPRR